MPRLTMTKSRKKTNTTSREFQEMRAEGMPTDKEFQSWNEYYRFVVTDNDKESHEVKKGDCVLVLPPEHASSGAVSALWVGRVRSIRSPASEKTNVWIKIQWFYSTQDLAPLSKLYKSSLPPPRSSVAPSPYERVFSDHYDIIHHATVDGVIPVTRYDELDLSPERIAPGSFWTRYDFEHRTRVVQPKLLPYTCTVAADTDSERPKSKGRQRADHPPQCGAYHPSEVMHLCPHNSCMVWWHAKCLAPAPSPLPRRDRFAANIDTTAVQRILTSSSGDLKMVDFQRSKLRNVSAEVVRAAGQPMVRGGRFGVVGNVREVAEARRQVLKKMNDPAFQEEDEEVDEDEEDEEQGDDGPARKKHKGLFGAVSAAIRASSSSSKEKLPAIVWSDALVDDVQGYSCPRCGNAI